MTHDKVLEKAPLLYKKTCSTRSAVRTSRKRQSPAPQKESMMPLSLTERRPVIRESACPYQSATKGQHTRLLAQHPMGHSHSEASCMPGRQKIPFKGTDCMKEDALDTGRQEIVRASNFRDHVPNHLPESPQMKGFSYPISMFGQLFFDSGIAGHDNHLG